MPGFERSYLLHTRTKLTSPRPRNWWLWLAPVVSRILLPIFRCAPD